MGKVKIATQSNTETTENTSAEKAEVKSTGTKSSKKKVAAGMLFVDATFNNTKVLFADKIGNALAWSSAGSLGFKGAKKGTPFAASKVGDVVGAKAIQLGAKEVDVVVRGVGSGREPSIRAFMAHGIDITSVKDATPVPHNGPKAKKPRRV